MLLDFLLNVALSDLLGLEDHKALPVEAFSKHNAENVSLHSCIIGSLIVIRRKGAIMVTVSTTIVSYSWEIG